MTMPPTGPVAPSGGGGFRKVFDDVASFATSQYALRFANIIRGFAVAKLLGPAGNGLLQHFVILFEYGQQAQLGILPGTNKHLGHQVGAGDEVEIGAARDTGLGGMVAVGVVVWLVLCGYTAANWATLHPVDRVGVPVVGLLVILENITNTYKALLRSYGRIRPISILSVSFAVSNLALSLALLPGLKMHGILLAWLVTRAVTTFVFVRRSGHRFRPQLDFRVLKRLMVIGLPISAFHLTRLMLRNVDRVLVDTVLDKADLGIYGFAVTLASLVRYGADAVGFVIYPLFLRRFGETRDPRELKVHLAEPTAFLAVFVPVVLGFLALTLPVPIHWILPDFADSIPVFRLLTVSVFFASLSVLPGFFMMAINRQNWLIPIGFGTVAFTYLVGFAAIRQGYGLPGVAAVADLGLALDTTIVLAIAGRFAYGSLPKALAWIARLYAPPVYVLGVLAAIRWAAPFAAPSGWNEATLAVVEGFVFLLVMAPVLWVFERRTRFLARLTKGRGGSRGSGAGS
ncbi:oligosaccharide flippase family protein [bacterium]|nr:oligosaccharide flippase family protein [bacterium]